MRDLGINLAVGIVAAYIAYQLGAWRERVFFIGLEERSQEFRKKLRDPEFQKRLNYVNDLHGLSGYPKRGERDK